MGVGLVAAHRHHVGLIQLPLRLDYFGRGGRILVLAQVAAGPEGAASLFGLLRTAKEQEEEIVWSKRQRGCSASMDSKASAWPS
ncbi:hypothetical protein DN412_11715 [Cupriavidus lacunae]|uniref:Uncharacterized protein n=1 Tax=Cupriavidus lacunae TaxID=2666307 RepID=A0A370NWR7_9BURK|nr:hypothetical protein DN412_11715 [Cupriavidus lacunae]